MTQPTARTGNNAKAYEHSEDHLLEFFSKAGSLYTRKGYYYDGEETALDLFKIAWRAGREKECMQLLFWLRDIRGPQSWMNTKKNNIKECQSDRHRITIIEDAINADGDAYQKITKLIVQMSGEMAQDMERKFENLEKMYKIKWESNVSNMFNEEGV